MIIKPSTSHILLTAISLKNPWTHTQRVPDLAPAACPWNLIFRKDFTSTYFCLSFSATTAQIQRKKNNEVLKLWKKKKRHSFCFDLIYLHKHHHVWNRYIYFPETYEKRSLAFLFLQHFQFMQNKISIPHLSLERQFNFNSCRREIFCCLHLQKVGSWRLLVLEDDSSCAWIEKFYFFLLERKR